MNIDEIKEKLDSNYESLSNDELNDIKTSVFDYLLFKLFDVETHKDLNKILDNYDLDFDGVNFEYETDYYLDIIDFDSFKDSYTEKFMDLRQSKLNNLKEDDFNLYTSYVNAIENNLSDSLFIVGRFKKFNTFLKNRLEYVHNALRREEEV